MNDLALLPAHVLAARLRDGRLSSRALLEACLARVARHNAALQALVTLNAEGARARADAADAALSRGERWGPLHGLPFSAKDVFATAGLRSTAAHAPLADHLPDMDATAVARLRAAGAILLGKSNLPELGMDTQCDNSLFGVTKNPWDPTRTPGGSSGGEAVALATGMSALGLGSDLGGSLRLPAHYCGVCALKPSEGRVPRTGHIPPLPDDPDWLRHLAVVGPMARSVADLRLAIQVLAGPDGRDPAALPVPLERPAPRPLSAWRVAWSPTLGDLRVARELQQAVAGLAEDLGERGCAVQQAQPAGFDAEAVWATYGELVGTLLAAGLPLGPRLALRSLGGLLFRDDPLSRASARRTTASMRDYVNVLGARDRLSRALDAFFEDHDAWLLPVSASPAPPLRPAGRINSPIEVDGHPRPGHLAAIGLTCPFNLTGHPAVTLPLGRTAAGLSMGVQLVGPRWGELGLLDLAEQVETRWGGFRAPPDADQKDPNHSMVAAL